MRQLLLLLPLCQLACVTLGEAEARASALSVKGEYRAAADDLRQARRGMAHEKDQEAMKRLEAGYRARAEWAARASDPSVAKALFFDLVFPTGSLERAEPGDARVKPLLTTWASQSPAAAAFFTPRQVRVQAPSAPPGFEDSLLRFLRVVGFEPVAGDADLLAVTLTRAAPGDAVVFGVNLVTCELAAQAQWLSQGAVLASGGARRHFAATDTATCEARLGPELASELFRSLLPGAPSP